MTTDCASSKFKDMSKCFNFGQWQLQLLFLAWGCLMLKCYGLTVLKIAPT